MKKLINMVERLKKVDEDFADIMQFISTSELDVNDYIVEKYPFGKSFEEFTMDFTEWVESVEEKVYEKAAEMEKEREEKEDKIIETIEDIAFGLGLDLVGHTDITYEMIFAFDLDYNVNATKVQIRKAIMEWKKDTEENYPEMLKAYLL